MKILRIAIAVLVAVLAVLPVAATAQTAAGPLEETIPPGENFDKAEFPIVEKSGLLGDLKGHTAKPLDESGTPNYPTAWLPTARVARAWEKPW